MEERKESTTETETVETPFQKHTVKETRETEKREDRDERKDEDQPRR